MIDTEDINKAYNTHITFISRTELEEALLDKFGSFGYDTFIDNDKKYYNIGCKFEWESYEYTSDFIDSPNTMDEAITDLFVKYSNEEEFKEIINNIERIPY